MIRTQRKILFRNWLLHVFNEKANVLLTLILSTQQPIAHFYTHSCVHFLYTEKVIKLTKYRYIRYTWASCISDGILLMFCQSRSTVQLVDTNSGPPSKSHSSENSF